MPQTTTITTGSTPLLMDAALDPDLEQARRKARRRDHYLRQLPLGRGLGFLLMSIGVLLHGYLIPGSASGQQVASFAAVALGYSLVSWALSWAWERQTGSLRLASAWIFVDPWLWNLSVLWTGGAQSWLYVGILMGLGGFVAIGPRQVGVTGASAITGYASLLAFQHSVLQRPVPLGQEALKLLLLGLAVGYLVVVARIVSSLRKQNRDFLNLTQTLNRELKTRAVELGTAKEVAEAESRAKSQFLAGMSHELRTPLNSILLYSELIEGESGLTPDSALAQDAHRIQGAGKHLLQLVNDLLDLSKIEAGRMELNPEPVDLEVLLEEVTLHARPLAGLHGNAFSSQNRVPDGAPPWEADTLRLRQILLNLLGNAAKFTEQGDIRLIVSQDATHRLFEVADTGMGMTPEQLGSIFKDFVQADASIAARYGGTGLGLTLSLRLCERMGGTLEVESQAGQGSTFKVRLPLRGEQ